MWVKNLTRTVVLGGLLALLAASSVDALDLLKRSEKAAGIANNITATEFDANLTAIEDYATATDAAIAAANTAISGKQPLDADLTTLAGVTPGATGLSVLQAANTAAGQTALSLVPGTNVQAYDADLATYAGITPTTFGQTWLGLANAAAGLSNLGAQAADADLTTYAGITPSATVQTLLGAASQTAARSAISAQAADADLDTYAGITPTTVGQNMLAAASQTAGRTAISAQAADADLDTYAGITPSSIGQAVLAAANTAAANTAIGSQPADADLSTYAGITPGTVGQNILSAANQAAGRTALGLGSLATLSTVGTTEISDGSIADADISGSAAIAFSKLSGVQASDADLTTYAGITPSSIGQALLAASSAGAVRTQAGDSHRVIAQNLRCVPPATGGAAPVTRVGGSTPAEYIFEGWAFDPTTDEQLDCSFRIPRDFAPGTTGIRVTLYTVSDATTGNQVFQGSLDRANGRDLDASNTYTYQTSGAVATSGTAGTPTMLTIDFSTSQVDSLVANDFAVLRLNRDADNTSATDSITANDVVVLEQSILVEELAP